LGTMSYGGILIFSWSTATGLGEELFVAGVILWIIAVIHSYVSVARSSKRDLERQPIKTKNQYLTVLLSFVVPGLGQLYEREFLIGIVFLLVYANARVFLSSSVINFVTPFVSALSAYVAVRKLKSVSRGAIIITTVLLFVVLIRVSCTYLGARYFAAVTRANGYSMEPTIQSGDLVIEDRRINRVLHRGEVIVASDPTGRAIDKRIIGFGGETVEIKNKHAYVNGVKLSGKPFDGIEYVSVPGAPLRNQR